MPQEYPAFTTPKAALRLWRGGRQELLRCGRCLVAPGVHHYRTAQLALVIVCRGEARYSDGAGRDFPLLPGQSFLRLPGLRHSLHVGQTLYERYTALPAEALPLLRVLCEKELAEPLLPHRLPAALLRRHDTLITRLRDATRPELAGVACALQEFMAAVITAQDVGGAGLGADWLERARELLEQELALPRSPQEVARMLGVGYSLFRKEFTRCCGVSPGQYRIWRKIERAQQMLLAGYAVSEVAQALGYADVCAFSAQFKGYIGVSPRQFLRS